MSTVDEPMSNDLFSMKDVDGLDFESAYQRLQA